MTFVCGTESVCVQLCFLVVITFSQLVAAVIWWMISDWCWLNWTLVLTVEWHLLRASFSFTVAVNLAAVSSVVIPCCRILAATTCAVFKMVYFYSFWHGFKQQCLLKGNCCGLVVHCKRFLLYIMWWIVLFYSWTRQMDMEHRNSNSVIQTCNASDSVH